MFLPIFSVDFYGLLFGIWGEDILDRLFVLLQVLYFAYGSRHFLHAVFLGRLIDIMSCASGI